MFWVVDVFDFFVDFLFGGGLWIVVFAGVALLIRLVGLVVHRWAVRRSVVAAPRSSLTATPSWSLTLLVRVDERAGVLRPSVQLRGSTLTSSARVRLELVDERGATRHTCERAHPSSAIGTELALPAFAAPDGVSVADVLGWHWDVVMEDFRGECARWREHPAPVGALNAEAELSLPGVRPF